MLFWNYNLARRLDGTVMPSAGVEPGQGAAYFSLPAERRGTSWRNARIVKTVSAECHRANIVMSVKGRGATCFHACGAGSDDPSSPCWIRCFFDTLLGRGSNASLVPVGGMDGAAIKAVWTAAFDDVAAGGCPEYTTPPPPPPSAPSPPARPPVPPYPRTPPSACPPDRNLGHFWSCTSVLEFSAYRSELTKAEACATFLAQTTIGALQASLNEWGWGPGSTFEMPAGLGGNDLAIALCRTSCNATGGWPC